MNNRCCVFIGGKQIGVNCLNELVRKGIRPSLVIGNLDDNGQDKSWHQSLVKTAKQNGLIVLINKKVNDLKIIEKIRTIKPEIIFCIGGTQIIPSKILKIPTLGCLNIHPALLPKYRGRYSTVHAIFNGEKFTGTTAHWMSEGIDSGPIIMRKQVIIDKNDTGRSLYEKVLTQTGTELFKDFLALWLSGKKIISKPQNEKKATYFPKGLPNNGQIDFSWNGKKILNFIRALTFEPFPPAEIKIGEKTMVIIDKKYFKGFK